MPKVKQTYPKIHNINTSSDTSKEYSDKISEKYYEEDYYELHQKEPFDSSILAIEQEYEVKIKPPYESELFKISFKGDEPEELIEDIQFEVELLACRLINNPDTLIDLIRKKPSLILNDYVIKYTIRKLQRRINPKEYSSSTEKTGEAAKSAIKIFKEAGIRSFIPRNAPKTNFPWGGELYNWKANPTILAKMVGLLRGEFDNYLESEIRRNRNKEEFYKIVYEQIHNKRLPTHLVNLISKYCHSQIYIALIFIADYDRSSPEATIAFWKKEVPKEVRKLAHRKNNLTKIVNINLSNTDIPLSPTNN